MVRSSCSRGERFREQIGCCRTPENVKGSCKSIRASGERLVEACLGAPRRKEMKAEMLNSCYLVRKRIWIMTLM